MWWLLVLLTAILNVTGGFDQRAELAQPAVRAPTAEPPTAFALVGVYGIRNDTSSGIWDVKANVELRAGSQPQDLSHLVLRLTDEQGARTYVHSADAPAGTGAEASETFRATWIRGSGTGEVMTPGNLVELHFNLARAEARERAMLELTLIPETGAPVDASVRMPPTFAGDLIITLR